MRTFEHPNISDNWVCPICGTCEDKPIILIPIVGTEEGNIIQAEQFHVDCINLYYHKEINILAQQINN